MLLAIFMGVLGVLLFYFVGCLCGMNWANKNHEEIDRANDKIINFKANQIDNLRKQIEIYKEMVETLKLMKGSN